jgi:vacuolar-type H+-ATPase subunit I/STV1
MWFATLLIFFVVFTAAVPADEIYTWTDSKGVTHISRTPPPPNARHQEVIEYTPQTPSEIEAIRQEREALQDRYDIEAILKNARTARREAEEARQRAEEAKAAAGEAEKRAAEFKKKVGNTIRRQQLNRGTILRLEAEALAKRNEALKAAQNADLAEKRAVEAERKAKDVLSRNENGEIGMQPVPERSDRPPKLGVSR